MNNMYIKLNTIFLGNVFSSIPSKKNFVNKGLMFYFLNRSVNICIQNLATLYILIIFEFLGFWVPDWYQKKMCENVGVCTVTYCCKQLLWFRYLWWHGIYLVFVYSFLVGANEYYWFVPNRNPLWFEKLLHILGKIRNFETASEGNSQFFNIARALVNVIYQVFRYPKALQMYKNLTRITASNWIMAHWSLGCVMIIGLCLTYFSVMWGG